MLTTIAGTELSYVTLLTLLSEIVSSSEELQAVLSRSVTLIQKMLLVERTSILVLDKELNQLVMGASAGIPADVASRITVALGEGIAGKVAETGEPQLVSSDGSVVPRPVGTEDRRYTTNSYISVPIRRGTEVLGVINITNKRDRAPLGREDLAILQAAARFLGQAMDRARLNAEILRLNNRLLLTLEHMPVGIMVLQRDAHIMAANQRTRSLLQIPPNPGDQLHQAAPGHARLIMHVVDLALRRGEQETLIAEARDHTGIPLRLTAVPIVKPGEEPEDALVIIEDLSLSREVEELRRLDEMKTNFISLVSHELRTPLTSMRGSVHLLGSYYAKNLDETQLSLLRIVGNNLERLILLVNNILDISQIDNHRLELRRERCDLRDIVDEAVEGQRGIASARSVMFHVDFPDALSPVVVDRVRLGQAIGAVLDNAVKHTGKHTVIHVTASPVASGIELTIQDEGEGIPPEYREKVFQKFFQVENPMTRRRGGSGLGLYIAREVMSLHGGSLGVVEAERGTAMRFVIPVG